MACQGCRDSFSEFEMKVSCDDCGRHFCFRCLSYGETLCVGCRVLRRRPLTRSSLAQVSVSDMLPYLARRNISASHLKKKEDIVDLVLMSAGQPPHRSVSAQSNDKFVRNVQQILSPKLSSPVPVLHTTLGFGSTLLQVDMLNPPFKKITRDELITIYDNALEIEGIDNVSAAFGSEEFTPVESTSPTDAIFANLISKAWDKRKAENSLRIDQLEESLYETENAVYLLSELMMMRQSSCSSKTAGVAKASVSKGSVIAEDEVVNLE